MQHLLRRKIINLAFAILVFPLTGLAQSGDELNLPDHDSKLYRFGINLGYNKSHFSFTHHPSFLNQDSIMSVESINSTGINLAWLVNLNLSEHFDLRTYPLDLTFSERAFEYALTYPNALDDETPTTIKKVQSISLSLPIQIKFSSDRIGNMKVYTIAGVKFDYDLAANSGNKNTEGMITLKKFNYGVEGGVGFHIYFPYFVLSPELKVSWGFSNLHDRNADVKYSSVVDKINARMISFSLTVE